MIDPRDVHSLTDFQRNARSHIRRLKRTGRPAVLTINGKAALVVQDAEAYERTMRVAARAIETLAVLEGLQEVEAGDARPFEEVDRELRAKFARRRKRGRKKR